MTEGPDQPDEQAPRITCLRCWMASLWTAGRRQKRRVAILRHNRVPCVPSLLTGERARKAILTLRADNSPPGHEQMEAV